MKDISKSLADITNKINDIEFSSVDNLKQILEKTSEIKKIVDELKIKNERI